jgi:steroid delta-isomerase-like uncharacterized protein
VGDKELLEVARQIEEAFNAADWDAYSALVSNDTVFETPTARSQGRDEILRYVRGVKAAFPDMKVTVTKALACDDTVVEELSVEGTHLGPIQTPRGPIPATNRSIKLKTVMLFEFTNGKLVAYREYFDRAGLMAQLGIGAPAPASAVTGRGGPGTP